MCNQQKKSHISPSTRRYQPSARAESPPATKLVAVMSSKYITVDETQATSLAEAKILATQHEGLHWKMHRKAPGTKSKGTAVFQCNSHALQTQPPLLVQAQAVSRSPD